MTYLDCPRFHFAGTFFADPSTVNNDPDHYNNDAFDRDDDWVLDAGGWWNPDGRHSFRFENVTVRRAVGGDGDVVAGDPVIGLRFVTHGLVPAKLVDLDTDQQMVSTIFGLRVALVDGAGNVLLEGEMEPVPFTDIWRRSTSGAGDEAASAVYQSTLEISRWGDLSSAPFLGQLHDATTGESLSIKFNVDRYSMNHANPRFARGRIVGTVGIAVAGEPSHTVVGRQFGTQVHPLGRAFPSFRPASGVNYFPGVVDSAARKIRLDLGNALSVSAAGGSIQDVGELTLRCRADDGAVTEIASIDYHDVNWYETTAGIVDAPAHRELTDDEAALVVAGRLQLVARSGGQQRILSEEASVHVRADGFVARLDPGDECVVRLHVSRLGQPLAGATVNLFLLLPGDPEAAANFPVGGLTFPASVVSETDGTAEATLVAADPGDPRFFYFSQDPSRVHVDGQVYRVGYAVEGVTPPNPSNVLSVLVWNAFVPDDPPTWHRSMRKVLTQYGNLYPWMSKFGPRLDLAVYEQVAAQSKDIIEALDRPVTDPRYMPVSRDMSTSRREAMLTWLTNPGPDGKPLLGEEPAPGEVEEAAPPPPARRAAVETELGGKTAAGQRLSIAPQ